MYNIGYTTGVFDLIHVGHLNILKRAKEKCDYLIVGVNSDETTFRYKNKYPVIPEGERLEIIKSIKYVDKAILVDDVVRVDDSGEMPVYKNFQFDILFIGDDHKDDPRWQAVDKYLRKNNSQVYYYPYTKHISSTKLGKVIDEISKE